MLGSFDTIEDQVDDCLFFWFVAAGDHFQWLRYVNDMSADISFLSQAEWKQLEEVYVALQAPQK